MCGIAGICSLSEPKPVHQQSIARMLSALRHRGPDESGIYLDDWVGLGHNRLNIIDLSSGIQPMHNEDKTIWITFNGEIFNYIELREDLVKRGHSFHTSTDTEVILHLYEEKGPALVHHLNGQFALAIWDTKEKELFLARDRVGIRPLFYTFIAGQLIFASEVKAIFSSGEVTRELDQVALAQVLNYWTTLQGRTIFKNILELPPGHIMTLSRGKVTLQKYWDIPFSTRDEFYRESLEDLAGKLLDLICDATHIRLRADVPVGSYVSGGLDSSAITAIVKKEFNNRLRTFGITFEDVRFDERQYQNEIVSFLRTDHTALEVANSQIGKHFADVVWHCEKPLVRTAPVPLFMLSKLVHENGFKVVLTGEGADEVFGGYNIFRETKVRRFWARQPESKWRPSLIGRLYPYIFRNGSPEQFVKVFFGTDLNKVEDPFYSHRLRWENTGRIKTFLHSDLQRETSTHNSIEELRSSLPETFHAWDPLSKAQYIEMSIFLSNYLLSSQGDRVAMAHAVETRMPFLDYRIIEFMGRVPPKWRIFGLKEKYLLKTAVKSMLPESILKRPKHPYRAPIRTTLLQSGTDSQMADSLSEASLKRTGIFDGRKVGKFLKKMQDVPNAGEVDDMAIAFILSSQLIHEQFIAGFPARALASISPTLTVDLRSAGHKM